jgi:hypothetical protein
VPDRRWRQIRSSSWRRTRRSSLLALQSGCPLATPRLRPARGEGLLSAALSLIHERGRISFPTGVLEPDSKLSFFDEFTSVRVLRFRATGVIDPAKRQAVIPFPKRQVEVDRPHT